jgi:outer membrane protein assembly factor BamB
MRWFALIAASLIASTTAMAGDWPQWLGPNRDGTTTEIVKPWKGDLKVLWRADVGEGHSSPIVANGQVFLFAKVKDKDREEIQAWNVDDYKQHESASFERAKFSSQFGNGPSATPAFQDGKLFLLGVTGELHVLNCGDKIQPFDVKGAVTVPTSTQYEAPALMFGVSTSPLIEGDNLILSIGGKKGSVVALNRKSNEVAWQALNDPPSYASPVAIGKGEKRQIVCLTQKRLVSLSPKDGQLFWEFPFKDTLAESSTTPVLVGDLLIASSVTLGSVALKMSEKDGKPAVEQAWKNPTLTCYFSTPVAVGEHLYMINGSIRGVAQLRCVETKTGKILWTKPKVAKYHAALLRTGDNKLLMLDDGGYLTLIDPDPAGFKELAKSKICGETWAHPAIANGKLFVRDNKELLCIDLGEK